MGTKALRAAMLYSALAATAAGCRGEVTSDGRDPAPEPPIAYRRVAVFNSPGGFVKPSPDGKYVAAVANRGLVVMEVRTGKQVAATQAPDPWQAEGEFDWSPGSDALVWVSGREDGSAHQLWVTQLRVSGGAITGADAPHELNTNQAHSLSPVWWGANDRIVFLGFPRTPRQGLWDELADIWEIRADGSGARRLFTPKDRLAARRIEWLAPSPNGRWVAFVYGGGVDVFDEGPLNILERAMGKLSTYAGVPVMYTRLDDTRERQEPRVSRPTWFSSGEAICYAALSSDHGDWGVYAAPPAGGGRALFTNEAVAMDLVRQAIPSPRATPKSGILALANLRSIALHDIATGATVPLETDWSAVDPHWCASGKMLFYQRWREGEQGREGEDQTVAIELQE